MVRRTRSKLAEMQVLWKISLPRLLRMSSPIPPKDVEHVHYQKLFRPCIRSSNYSQIADVSIIHFQGQIFLILLHNTIVLQLRSKLVVRNLAVETVYRQIFGLYILICSGDRLFRNENYGIEI